MKLSLLLILTGILQVSASVYSQQTRMTFEMKNKTVKEVLTQIEENTDFRFFYNENFTDLDREVTIEASNNRLEDILDELLAESEITYRVLDNKLVVITPKSLLQQQRVTGKVTDASTGEPLPGVYVRIDSTTTGTVTDVEGNYTVDIPAGDVVLQFSFVGYNTENVSVNGQSQINIALVAELTTLDEVIVVGYGTQSKRTVTGSIQQVQLEGMVDAPVGQAAQMLQGRLSGVQITQTTGTPGAGMQIRVRGQASLTAGNDPLYVVDGFPISGDISAINPEEIESVSVLKDASSAALYGSRAANGVIMVTTKKAKTGKTNIGFSASYGIQSVPEKGRPDMMNGTEFATFKKESYESRGLAVPEQFQNPSEYGEGVDFYDAILRNAKIQDYNLNMSANRENFSGSAVLGVFSQDGVVLESKYKRYSLRLNSEFKINKYVSIGANLAPSYNKRTGPNTDGQFWAGGLVTNSLITWPIYDYILPDGTMPLNLWDPAVNTFPSPNPIRAAYEIENNTTNSRIIANSFIDIRPIEGLTIRSTINFDYGSGDFDNINPSTASLGFATVLPTTSSATFRYNNYYTWANENTITYRKSVGDHNLELLAGFTAQNYRSTEDQIRFTGFPDDRVPTLTSAANITRGTNDTYNRIEEWSLLSYIGRLNYNFRNKYIVSLAMRGDGMSRFGEDNKWGTFPSGSIGWVVSEESFMNNLNVVSFLKLRASYGLVGNANIPNYTQYATVQVGGNAYSAIFDYTQYSGAAVTNLENKLVSWEKTSEADFGFDIGLYDNRINLTYDYYNRVTESLLYTVNVAQESGFTNFTGNIGELEFWGHEFLLGTKNTIGDFKWNTDFNISFTDNKVNAIYGVIDRIYSGSNITMVGERIGLFYGMTHDGVYVDQEDFDTSPHESRSDVGTVKFRDIGGGSEGEPDNRITNGGDNDDRSIIGDPTPKFIFGLTNTFLYKNFDMSILLTGSYGNDVANQTDQGLTNLDGVFNVYKDVADRWKSEADPGAGKYGRTDRDTSRERDWFSTRFIHDASFISIKNITLGYTIPKSALNFVNSLRLYVSVQQLYTFTKYPGTNPEVSMNAFGAGSNALSLGNDYGSYPLPRTVSFGLNLNF